MIFTVVGDPHAKPDNLDKINKLFDQIEDLANPCIILGDLLDTKEMVRGKCLNTYLRRLRSSKLEFIILVGNHDYFNLDCKEHSLEALKTLPNVQIIDRPQKIHEMWFLPYMHKIEDVSSYDPLPLFCHMDMPGFDFGNGRLSEQGIDYKHFKNFPIVISGHYHAYQQKDNIVYIGSPFSHSFGESNQTKYLGLFDTETNTIELLATDFPKHMTYKIDANSGILPEIQESNYNRFIITGPQDKVDALEVPENIKKIVQYTQNNTVKTIVDESQSNELQFTNWAKDIAELEPDLIDLGLSILNDLKGV
jgi:DNA repair exonuclease SbcCD nuclease subunit